SHAGGRALWPPEERRFAFPTRQMNSQFSISGNIVTVINREDLPEMTVRYRVTRHTVDPAQGYRIDASKFQTSTTDPMPGYVRPCRIDNDDRVDFAGGDWEFEQTSVMPAPVYETYVTLDGGRSDQRIRTRSLRPHCSFLDFDGDGDLDRVTESTGLYDGGVRESISRFLTSRDVVHEIQVWFQDARGQFSETPSVSGRFTVRLDAPPVGNSAFFRRYLAAELFNLTGDFNGDGYRDLVVWERPRQLAVYLSSGAGFETTPAATLTVPEESRFSIADIDQDRLSDIVVQPDGGADTALVYFAEEDAP
ncbi:MAG: repeat-containing protein, partial [Candidatus Hydrogenedentes bacterium]|nr:repeat-containing protein [Candidatus Hydrogenedentota bacterium]